MGQPRGKRSGAKPLKRRVGQRRERRTILVLCEGENSEPDYIKGLKSLPVVMENSAIDIAIADEHGVPMTLVDIAAERRRNDEELDEVWCIFDVEWPKNHPRLKDALQKARDNDLRLAVSNPCFELWLILHLEDCRKWNDSKAAESRSRSLDSRSGKHIDPDKYIPFLAEACKRAERLDGMHEQNGTDFPRNNPSSTMYRFVRAIGAV
ncbi:RloB family protein [Gordonia sp. NPDC003376]